MAEQNGRSKQAQGKLELVHGSMFAGKTEHLIARLRQETQAHRVVIAFKHAIDDRYDPDHLVTHRQDRFDAVRVSSAKEILTCCNSANVVAVDEVHFFGCNLVPVVAELMAKGVDVIAVGISYDIWGRDFEPIPQLTALANTTVVLQAPCRVCGEPSPYNQRMTSVHALHMVGGLEDYEPRCAEHFTPCTVSLEQR